METDGSARGEIAPWGFLVMAAMFVGINLAAAAVLPQVEARPGLLVAALLGGPVAGAVVAGLVPSRTGTEGKQRSPGAVGAARATLLGLAGLGLILAQSISVAGLVWLTIGGTALAAGAAGHAWAKKRRTLTPSGTR